MPERPPPVAAQVQFFATSAQWRAWLAEHHAREREILVGFHKVGSGRASMTWPESVDEALCFGWIDGVRRGLDQSSYTIRFTPRRPGSHWSRVNIAKVDALIDSGRMRPAGLAAFQARRPDRTAQAAHERDSPAVLDADAERAFRADTAAWDWFCAQPPWYRRGAIHWVSSARRPQTQARRLDILIECSRAGRPVPPLRRRPVGAGP